MRGVKKPKPVVASENNRTTSAPPITNNSKGEKFQN
jgi:hypothetical protein